MTNITVTSTTFSYVIFKNFVLKPKETGVLSTDDFVLSEYKSLKNLVDTYKVSISGSDYDFVVSKIEELSPSTGGGSGGGDSYTKQEIDNLLLSKLGVNGVASSSSVLTPGRTIELGGSIVSDSVLFTGSDNVVLNVNGINGSNINSGVIPVARIPVLNQNTTGSSSSSLTSGSADKLTTARTIGGVSFDGSSNINLPGVNTVGNQNTTGNAATATLAASATKLATVRTINGVNFDGSANITVVDNSKLPLTGGTVSSLTLSNALPLGSGGTGANNPTQAKINLGLIDATTTTTGLMSATDKLKLDGLTNITIRKMTQAEYDALSSSEKLLINTLYVIVG